MIGLYAKIPFHAQLKRSDEKLAADLSRIARETAASFGGILQMTEESVFICFDDRILPCRLRAAEAARSIASRLKGLATRLHGWSIILESGFPEPEIGLRSIKRLWYGIGDDGLFLGPACAESLAAYFRSEPKAGRACRRIIDAPYAAPALPVEGSLPSVDQRAVDRIVDEIGELVLGEGGARCIAVLGPGASTRAQLEAALATLYKGEAAGFLRLRASASGCQPHRPLAEGLERLVPPPAGLRAPEFLSGAERDLLEELGPMLEFIRRSPYRRGFSTTLETRLRLRAAVAFRLYARERNSSSLPALILLEDAERFPAETVDLLSDLLVGRLSDEGITVLISGRSMPPSWPSAHVRRINVSGPSPGVMARAAREGAEAMGAAALAPELAALAAGDPFRLRLGQRLAMSGARPDPAMSSAALAARAIATFPPEYAGLFLALKLCDGALGRAETEAFLDSLGYVAGVRPLVFAALAELGLAEDGAQPRLARADAAAEIESALDDGGAFISGAFASRLLELREKRLIQPSSALYERIAAGMGGAWGRYGNLRLFLDCVYADCAYGASKAPAGASGEGRDPPLAAMTLFLASYAAGQRERALALLSDMEAGAEALAASGPATASEAADDEILKASIGLARAAAEYSERRPQVAATMAKSALMGFHARHARSSEARAQRLLGLCALAQEQANEASDYLANAFETAESVPDGLECVLSAQAESAAQFVLGDLRRARQRALSAASWAGSSYRADWEAASAFIEGRIALELGDCAAAEAAFGFVRAGARVYNSARASARAEIWTGRSAAWAGEAGRGRDLLRRHPDDAEALWFLAELEAWEGRYAEARGLAERAQAALKPRGYPSADAFSWDSGFDSLEGRAVGFRSELSYLEDQIIAFRDFAAGMADPPGEGRRRAELLALRTREERLAAVHPAAHLFQYYRYLVVERSMPASMEAATALSKAFKTLQVRSRRMDEARLKDAFMEHNRWNRGLLADARARKLL